MNAPNLPATPRVRTKICGITSLQDALATIASGADALGFNTFTGSKRYVDLNEVAPWVVGLPSFVARVAVMVNPSLGEALTVARLPFIDWVQFHGDETPGFCAQFAESKLPFIKAVAVGCAADLEKLAGFHTSSILLDASVAGQFGGTGTVIDWQLARQAVERFPQQQIILSGGLHADNVREAVAKVAPYAVDVASGVESAPGVKNPAMVQAFIRETNQWL